MPYIHGLSLVDTSRVNISNSSLKRFSFEKEGVIELNKVRIRIDKNDSLQSLVSKINNKTSLHKIKARLVKERGQNIVCLAATKEVKIIDVKGILNNVSISIIVKPESNYRVHNLLNEEFYLFLATRWNTNNLPSGHFSIPDCEPSEESSQEVQYSFDSGVSQFEPSEESSQEVQSVDLDQQEQVRNRTRTRAYTFPDYSLQEYMELSSKEKQKVDAYELYLKLSNPDQKVLLTFAEKSVRNVKEKLGIQKMISEIEARILLSKYLPDSLGVTTHGRTRSMWI